MGQLCGTVAKADFNYNEATNCDADVKMKAMSKKRCPKHPDVDLSQGWGKPMKECYRCKMEWEASLAQKCSPVKKQDFT